MSDVFISYKREEREKVETLVAALRKLDLDVWYDYEIVPGDQFERVINQNLQAAKAVVVCWSKGAVDSEWVQAEADKARAAEKFASVQLEPCELPMPYNVLHWADLTTWSGALRHEGVRQLVNKLASLINPRLKAKYAELCESEERSTETILKQQGDDDEADDYDSDSPAPSADYVFGALKAGAQHARSSDLSAVVTQALFEEEILRDECTRWIVAAGEGVPIDVPKNARLTRSLNEALAGADDGDCIVVLPGTYSGRFEISKKIRVVGFGAKDGRPVLTGNDPNVGGVLKVSAAARIENLVVESRQRGHALLVASGSGPTIIRCLISRFQLVPHDWASAHVETGSRPIFLACTITGGACPAMQFAGNARGTIVATDITSRDFSAIVLTGGAKPLFDRCTVIANGAHAVVSSATAAGVFEDCYLRSTQDSAVVNEDTSFSKFIGNRVSARHGSLIEVKGFARGRFERNRLEPCPELRAREEAERQKRPPLFGRRAIVRIPAPIQVSAQHRARFAENRLPDGSVAQPVQIS